MGSRMVIEDGTFLGPIKELWTIGDIQVGKGCTIEPGVFLCGPLVIGDNVTIHPGCIIGQPAETYDPSDADPEQVIRIGDGTTLRENVVVQRGLKNGQGTIICPGSYIMHGCHIAHDVHVHDECTLAPRVVLGGHTVLHERVNMGIGSMTHQWVHVGAWSMVGMGSVVLQNVLPGRTVVGNPAKAIKMNQIGLEKFGVSGMDIENATKCMHQESKPNRGWVEGCR